MQPGTIAIKNKATGTVWDVVIGSPTHRRCTAQPDAYEVLKPGQDEVKPLVVASPPDYKPTKKTDKPEKSG
jgi:hypothetical protein